MMSSESTRKSRYAPWIFAILLFLFAGPMIAAWSLYASDNRWLLGETVNSGELIQPPLDFSQFKLTQPIDFKGTWLMVYITPLPCTMVCQNNLYKMRQVWLALGKDMDRVQRVLITFSLISSPDSSKLNKKWEKEFPGMQYASTTKTAVKNFFALTSLSGIVPEQGALYLVDPRSNLMLAYTPAVVPKGLLNDLTRLLNTSQIG